jgi:cystathionine beta-lyase/cystathionine gamma-synthase
MSAGMRFSTKLVHAGEPRPRIAGSVALPIFQSSTFEYGGEASYNDVHYVRLSNTPNHEALHAKLAALEETESALVTSSGMAAIAPALLALLRPGDHVLAHRCLYGGTRTLFTTDLAELGITTTFVDAHRPETFARALTPKTKLFYVETMTNPLLEVVELEAVAAFTREKGLLSLIDSTLTTPYNFRPATRGFDLVLHSATKYLNGHSDIAAGAVAGSRELVGRIKRKVDYLGGSLDPHACFLLSRGLRTLDLRMERHNRSGLALSRFLSEHAAVAEVFYPGLESHAGHARAKAWFQGSGGLLSFRPKGGVPAADRFLSKARLAASAPSLGGPETLLTRPATTSHAGQSAAERAELGITDDLVRVAVGLESEQDLIEDFDQALA